MTAALYRQFGRARRTVGAQTSRGLVRRVMALGVAAGAVLAGGPPAQAQSPAGFGAAWKTVDCKRFDLPDAVAALSDCGYVTVPEQHALPKGRTIQLAVVRMRSTGSNPAPDPLFVEQGGPGDSTIGVIVDQAYPNLPELKAVLKGRDLVFVEERGTRYSRPFLTCPEYDARNIAVARGEMAYTDPTWFKTCQARFQKQGIRLGAFNTVENAADVYFVAETLGYPVFNYYGVSYGTLLGQYVIAQADQHKAKLRSVIIDGVVRTDIDFNLASGHSVSFALRNLFHACAQDQQCSRAYPDLEQTFLTVYDRLDRQPVSLTLTTSVTKQPVVTRLDGKAFVTALVPLLGRPYSGNSVGEALFGQLGARHIDPQIHPCRRPGQFRLGRRQPVGRPRIQRRQCQGDVPQRGLRAGGIGADDARPGAAAALSATARPGRARGRGGGEGLLRSRGRSQARLHVSEPGDPHADIERGL